MKKIIAITLASLLIIISVCLSGCQISSEKIELNKDNIEEYLNIDLDAEPTGMTTYNSPLGDSMGVFSGMVVNGTIHSIEKYSYENVSISISVKVETTGPNTIFGQTDDYVLKGTIDLDSEGFAVINIEEDADDYVGVVDFAGYEIDAVSGYVVK